MSSNDDRADLRSRKNDAALNRRSILIGATMLAAASMLGVKAPTQVAQAQAPSTQSKPNLFILADKRYKTRAGALWPTRQLTSNNSARPLAPSTKSCAA
jgi:hypothetical protein